MVISLIYGFCLERLLAKVIMTSALLGISHCVSGAQMASHRTSSFSTILQVTLSQSTHVCEQLHGTGIEQTRSS